MLQRQCQTDPQLLAAIRLHDVEIRQCQGHWMPDDGSTKTLVRQQLLLISPLEPPATALRRAACVQSLGVWSELDNIYPRTTGGHSLKRIMMLALQQKDVKEHETLGLRIYLSVLFVLFTKSTLSCDSFFPR